MNKQSAIFSALLLSIIIGWASCAKREAAQTPFTKIQGNWKLVKTATDDNGNSKIEGNEIHPVPSAQDDELTFNEDLTGVETNVYNGVSSLPLNFNWDISSADSVWCAFTGHDTLTYYLLSISSGNLTLQTNTTFGLAAYYYNKH